MKLTRKSLLDLAASLRSEREETCRRLELPNDFRNGILEGIEDLTAALSQAGHDEVVAALDKRVPLSKPRYE